MMKLIKLSFIHKKETSSAIKLYIFIRCVIFETVGFETYLNGHVWKGSQRDGEVRVALCSKQNVNELTLHETVDCCQLASQINNATFQTTKVLEKTSVLLYTLVTT